MDRPTTEQPTTEQPTTEQPAAEQSATLADEELQEVAAGAASQIDHGASLHQVWPSRTRSAEWWRDDSATLTGSSSGGSGLT